MNLTISNPIPLRNYHLTSSLLKGNYVYAIYTNKYSTNPFLDSSTIYIGQTSSSLYSRLSDHESNIKRGGDKKYENRKYTNTENSTELYYSYMELPLNWPKQDVESLESMILNQYINEFSRIPNINSEVKTIDSSSINEEVVKSVFTQILKKGVIKMYNQEMFSSALIIGKNIRISHVTQTNHSDLVNAKERYHNNLINQPEWNLKSTKTIKLSNGQKEKIRKIDPESFKISGEQPLGVIYLNPNDIFINIESQRKVIPSNVIRILMKFDWSSFGVITLIQRTSGELVCVDGQHRILAAIWIREHYKKEFEVPVVIIPNTMNDLQLEPRVFLSCNSGAALTPYDLHINSVRMGEVRAVSIDRLCKQYGFELVSPYEKNLQNYNKPIKRLSSLHDSWEEDFDKTTPGLEQGKALEYGFRLVSNIFHSQRRGVLIDADMIENIGRFWFKYYSYYDSTGRDTTKWCDADLIGVISELMDSTGKLNSTEIKRAILTDAESMYDMNILKAKNNTPTVQVISNGWNSNVIPQWLVDKIFTNQSNKKIPDERYLEKNTKNINNNELFANIDEDELNDYKEFIRWKKMKERTESAI